ncbi:MAG: IS110 family transposase [Acidimicrobiales bacterium]
MSTNSVHPKTSWVGLDVHKDSITSAVLRPGRDVADVDRWFHDQPSVRRFVAGLGDRALVRACYEAGPTGYDLARLLSSLGVRCEVIAPSLIPTVPGARVKTDTRDARRLAQLHRAGELVAVRIPAIAEEGIRDLCRTRADLMGDRTRARHRLGKFLLRHGQARCGGAGTTWTHRHEAWLGQVRFGDAAMGTTYCHYRAVLATVDANFEAVQC